jgi:hypothetical protein
MVYNITVNALITATIYPSIHPSYLTHSDHPPTHSLTEHLSHHLPTTHSLTEHLSQHDLTPIEHPRVPLVRGKVLVRT